VAGDLEKSTAAHLIIDSQHVMEPESSLPFLKEPVTDPYHEPDESSPHPFILLFSELLCFSHLC
jgi:hypothetical protein